MGIIPERATRLPGAEFSLNPIGSGPFHFSSHIPNRELVMRRFEHYFGQKPLLKGIQFKFIKDGMIRTMELMKGTIELTQNDIPPRLVALIRNKPNTKLSSCPSNNYTYIGFNMNHPILKKAKVRQAIAYAINRQAIIDQVFQGTAIQATGLLNPDHWAYESDVVTYKYNLVRAQKLLDEAGFPDPD
ncbi:ABC transporter substrate-binding protein, partial [candidate division CSSED10-310 bacterium]